MVGVRTPAVVVAVSFAKVAWAFVDITGMGT